MCQARLPSTPGYLHPPYRVLQCYTAWPACTKLRFRVLHRVLQSATRGATRKVARHADRQECRRYSIWNFGFDEFGQEDERFLPAEVAGFGGDDVGNAFLDDV